ncbi:MAG: RNA polymerase sigma factor [Lachnospiraceae bacterium]|nr:RNA polymerase sigma factor [Lachnospiraceae bacterium]MDD3794742.1 RNA polymerase sigma factor [Lachnospiraceae bacterium]
MSYEEKEALFIEWYEQYRKLVFKVVCQETKDVELAKDFCQQAALRLWLHLEYLADRSEEERKGWLLRVVGNLIKDHWKKASTRREILQSQLIKTEDFFLDQEMEQSLQKQAASKTEALFIRQLECVDFILKVLNEIRCKNEEWYELIELLYLKNHTQEETAQVMNISVERLRARLYRMRVFIRKRFAEQVQEVLI